MQTRLLSTDNGYTIAFVDGETVHYPRDLKNLSPDVLSDMLAEQTTRKTKAFKTLSLAALAFSTPVEGIVADTRAQYAGMSSPPAGDAPSIERYTDWQQLQSDVSETLGEAFLPVYKTMMATIVSLSFSEKDSIYLVLFAPPGSGKSTLCSLFSKCQDVLRVDDMTFNAFAAGTASPDQESNSLLDAAANKTLIIHDLTKLFSDDPKKLRNVKGVLENNYGECGHYKFSPGAGNRHYGARLNLIFGVTPYYFWQKYPGTNVAMGIDLISTERYIFARVPDRDHFFDYLAGRRVTRAKLDDLAHRTAGYIAHLVDRLDAGFDPGMGKDAMWWNVRCIEAYFERLEKKDMGYKHGTESRRMNQAEMYVKAMSLIENAPISESMFEEFASHLDLPRFSRSNELDIDIDIDKILEDCLE